MYNLSTIIKIVGNLGCGLFHIIIAKLISKAIFFKTYITEGSRIYHQLTPRNSDHRRLSVVSLYGKDMTREFVAIKSSKKDKCWKEHFKS